MKAIVRIFIKVLLRILFRIRISGNTQPLFSNKTLVIANHESFLDGLLLGAFLPIKPVFVVHTEVTKNWLFKLILMQVEYLAVDPTSPMAMKKIIKLVDSGRPVVIFPEGRITTTGSLMKVYDGPAFVAAKTGATVVPVRLDGPARSYFSRMSGRHPKRFFPRITLSIQEATTITMPNAASAKLRRRKSGEAMRQIMQTMLFYSYPKTALFSSFIQAMATHGRKQKVVEDLRQIEYTYGELLKMALALGRISTKISEEKESVGLLLPNLATTLCLMLGMTAFRRVPAMLNYTAGTEGMQSACTLAKVRTIITSKQFLETAKITHQVAALKEIQVIYLEDLKAKFNLFDKLWLMSFALWFPKLATKKIDIEEPAVILFTSGSEGKPKGVVLSHRTIISNVAQIRSVIDFSIEDKFLNALPIFHAFGLTGGAILPLLSGARLFLYPSPLHYRVIPEVIYDRGCTVLLGTSTFLGNYAKFAHPYDFYRLRYVIAGAEKLNEEVRKIWFEKFGIRILEGYGATETAPVLSVNTPMAYRSGTAGQLLPAIKSKIVSIPGIDQGGLLHVQGPNLMLGYYLFDEPGVLVPPQSEVGHGWYSTGDVVEIDEDGFVRILGRVKRFAKVAGEMVSLEVVEKIANSASREHQHAASTQADVQRGETIILFTTDPDLTRDKLQPIAKQMGYPEIAVARKVVKLDALPLLGTGKTDYVSLKKLAEIT